MQFRVKLWRQVHLFPWLQGCQIVSFYILCYFKSFVSLILENHLGNLSNAELLEITLCFGITINNSEWAKVI